jgi:hypothetical protein
MDPRIAPIWFQGIEEFETMYRQGLEANMREWVDVGATMYTIASTLFNLAKQCLEINYWGLRHGVDLGYPAPAHPDPRVDGRLPIDWPRCLRTRVQLRVADGVVGQYLESQPRQRQRYDRLLEKIPGRLDEIIEARSGTVWG